MSPIGATINGARLWVRIGSMSFQPGELAKICLVIFFAAYLAERKELLAIASKKVAGIHFPDLKHFGPLLLMWGMSLAVMFYEKDLGSSLLFFSIFLLMIYIATARFVYVGVGGLLFVGGRLPRVPGLRSRADARRGVVERLRPALHQRRGVPTGPIAIRARNRRPLRHGVESRATRT